MDATKNPYQPSRLLDTVINHLHMQGDAQLAKSLSVRGAMIRGIRLKSLPIYGFLLMRMSELTGMKVDDLRQLMGDRRNQFRVGYKLNRLSAALAK